jgi:hypothetical protein
MGKNGRVAVACALERERVGRDLDAVEVEEVAGRVFDALGWDLMGWPPPAGSRPASVDWLARTIGTAAGEVLTSDEAPD